MENKIEIETAEENLERPRIIVVTGMSGSGKTQACRCLEDLGYFCVDNLPPVFIPKFVELCSHASSHVTKVVFVVDTRSREFFDKLVSILEDMDKKNLEYEMLFMDAKATTQLLDATRKRAAATQWLLRQEFLTAWQRNAHALKVYAARQLI